jgi:hypothetical protein
VYVKRFGTTSPIRKLYTFIVRCGVKLKQNRLTFHGFSPRISSAQAVVCEKFAPAKNQEKTSIMGEMTTPVPRDDSHSASPLPSRWNTLPACASCCNRYLVRVPNHKIGVVNAILESYEHVCRVGTFDIQNGILEIIVPQESDEEFQNAAAHIAEKIEWVFQSWQRPMKRDER